jgi:hypothetical protein
MRNKAHDYSLRSKKEKQLTITFEGCCALLRVNLMLLYFIMKAKRNPAQVSFWHLQQLHYYLIIINREVSSKDNRHKKNE